MVTSPLLFALGLALAMGKGHAADFGLIVVRGTGLPTNPGALHAVGEEWQRQFVTLSPDGSTLSLNGGGALQLAATSTAGAGEPYGYFQWSLLGNELSYTVDLSNVGCSCNAALYFVSMPGYNRSSTSIHPDPLQSYYCGANAGKPSRNTSNATGRGNYCPEMDVLEANKFAAQSTPHICNGTNRGPGFYPMCDWHGCATAVYNMSKAAMCPSANCTIDTRRPFRHSVSFPRDARTHKLASIRNLFEQEGRSFAFDSCTHGVNAQWTGGDSAAYLEKMDGNLAKGMVMDISLWGLSNKGMGWLDGPTGCQGDCNVSASSVTFSDVILNRLKGLHD